MPAVCYARDPAENDSNNILMNNDESDRPPASQLSCLHGQKYYQHGAQWTSLVDECYMCNCHYGGVACDPIVCPTVRCLAPVTKTATCCPTCEGKLTLRLKSRSISVDSARPHYRDIDYRRARAKKVHFRCVDKSFFELSMCSTYRRLIVHSQSVIIDRKIIIFIVH